MRSHSLFVFLSLAFVFGIVGCAGEQPRPPAADPKAAVMQPQRRELTDYEEFNGWLSANETVQVRARVRGHIVKVHFKDGDIVKEGDLLFELDPEPFEADIGKAIDRKKIYEAQKVAADKDEARL
ncbi:MAG: biotin/lipoyl-binding protein, partial [Gemmataceae bacterium]|nr:biotin/lipoyl-binding protein [Gemmataceae bacterium]